ncbi:MAG TPA: CAP domain-containing protein [Ktedonobacteraceae bacterium]
MKKICWGLLCLSLIVLLAACGSQVTPGSSSSSSIASDSLSHTDLRQQPTPTPTQMPPLSIPSQKATPRPHIPASSTNTPTPVSTSTSTPPPISNCVTYSNEMTWVPSANGTLAAPYGPAPVSAEAQQLTQLLFQLINHDRAACGLPPFAWNQTLASGALLHSWNMEHCGFSHTCPDGMTPYQRIANEGFAGLRDCGENIGMAGPYPTPWGGVSSVQESMAHEPLGGWHRIHLFSTTLHRIGIGVYVDGSGNIWFTEDMLS